MLMQGSCDTCKFSVNYEPPGPKPEIDRSIDRSNERHGIARFFLGSGVDTGEDFYQHLWGDIIAGWKDKKNKYDLTVQCRLMPEFVQKLKTDWCSHYHYKKPDAIS